MPTYEYVCEKCGHRFEKFQPISATPLTICPKELCARKRWGKGKVKRAISTGGGLIFKGSGFYTTDYRSEKYKEAAKKEAAPASSPGAEGKPARAEKASPRPPSRPASRPKLRQRRAKALAHSAGPTSRRASEPNWQCRMKQNVNATVTHRALLVAAVAILLDALGGLAGAQPANPDLVSARSHSGQFIVYAGRASTLPSPGSKLATSQNFVQLEPTLATVSCERIKQALRRELGATAPWRGNIYLVLYPARGPGDTITITSERFKGGWQYRVDFPDVVERSRYVRVVVQVLLLELANRTAEARAAEIPLWLVEGFSQLLLASNEAEIILPPPRATANRVNFSATLVKARKETLLEQAQKKLRGRPPLTFEKLSWPAEDEWSGDTGDLYSGSAQLFVGELLRLPDGRACLRTMLAQLPQHYNWQFAFLRAFHAYFERPLDVEKWWALSLARASGRGLAQTWSLEESWQKLDQTLHSAVQVRTGANELPLARRRDLADDHPRMGRRAADPGAQQHAARAGAAPLAHRPGVRRAGAGLLPGPRNLFAATRSQRVLSSRRRKPAGGAPSKQRSSSWTRWRPGGKRCGPRQNRLLRVRPLPARPAP